ncbi:hypothetical protein [Acuticoccus sp.]|uniref:hypothetical protein n=1 Tax=Acuticoccus sp. TaxID=1904378 RepID=UPI003B525E24
MSDQDIFEFHAIVAAEPATLRAWQHEPAAASWARHYLVGGGHTLALVSARRIELTRRRFVDGLRVEDELLRADLPLDGTALDMIGRVLPPAIGTLKIDGRTAQRLVDSLAHPALRQASVLIKSQRMTRGPVSATVSTFEVPDWEATGRSIMLRSASATQLRAALDALRLARLPDQPLSDWLRKAHRAATADAGPRTRAA